MYSDVYNTTINFNGETMFSSSYTPCFCRCGRGFINSCFNFGYGGFGNALGIGLGYAAGMALVPALPAIFKGIGNGLKWLGTDVIIPSATFMWNSVLKPAGNAVWSGMKWVGNTVAKGAKAVAKGVSNLWNKVFHKKSSKSEKA